jgi:hypothetical protein
MTRGRRFGWPCAPRRAFPADSAALRSQLRPERTSMYTRQIGLSRPGPPGRFAKRSRDSRSNSPNWGSTRADRSHWHVLRLPARPAREVHDVDEDHECPRRGWRARGERRGCRQAERRRHHDPRHGAGEVPRQPAAARWALQHPGSAARACAPGAARGPLRHLAHLSRPDGAAARELDDEPIATRSSAPVRVANHQGTCDPRPNPRAALSRPARARRWTSTGRRSRTRCG